MKRLINNGDIFDKYVSFEDKKFRDDTIKQFNWLGHRHIAGTYSGAAYTTSLADNYMANNLRNDSNPKGSLLVAAKNYTDQKVATIGGGGVHCYVIQPQDYTANAQYKFVYFTSKDIQGKQMSLTNILANVLPPLHPYETNNYYPEIKQKVYLEQYPAQGRYHSQQVLFITITEYELFVYTWDPTKNKVVANQAKTWSSGGSESRYWYINKQY